MNRNQVVRYNPSRSVTMSVRPSYSTTSHRYNYTTHGRIEGAEPARRQGVIGGSQNTPPAFQSSSRVVQTYKKKNKYDFDETDWYPFKKKQSIVQAEPKETEEERNEWVSRLRKMRVPVQPNGPSGNQGEKKETVAAEIEKGTSSSKLEVKIHTDAQSGDSGNKKVTVTAEIKKPVDFNEDSSRRNMEGQQKKEDISDQSSKQSTGDALQIEQNAIQKEEAAIDAEKEEFKNRPDLYAWISEIAARRQNKILQKDKARFIAKLVALLKKYNLDLSLYEHQLQEHVTKNMDLLKADAVRKEKAKTKKANMNFTNRALKSCSDVFKKKEKDTVQVLVEQSERSVKSLGGVRKRSGISQCCFCCFYLFRI